MLDDFREWLSDYLRYFMLGGAILLVLLVVIFSVRACSGRKTNSANVNSGSGQEEQNTPSVTEDETKKEENVQQDAQNTENTPEEPEDTNPLAEANADITELIKNYYAALGKKDVDRLAELIEDLSPSDESKIMNASDYIEKYQVHHVYTKDGLREKEYVVYAEYEYYCQGIDVAVPALSRFYVLENEDGDWKIDGNVENDSEIAAYTKKIQSDADVKKLSSRVKKSYNSILEENADLKAFLQGLGEEEEPTEQTSSGTMMVANDDCNVRDAPSGDVIGGIYAGAQVETFGEEDGWIRIQYEGQDAYIYGTLLDEVG